MILSMCFLLFTYICFWLCWVFLTVRGPSPAAVGGLLMAAACPAAEHGSRVCRLQQLQLMGSRMGLSNCVRRLSCPAPHEVFPDQAGGFLTTEPPGKF